MKSTFILAFVCGCLLPSSSRAMDLKQAKFTQVVNKVEVISAADKSLRKVSVSDTFKMPDTLRTGTDSRTELAAADGTVTRVGANTIFSYDTANRTIDLQQGSILFHSPHGKGGGTIRTKSATASVIGTTIIVTCTPDGGFKLLDLEGETEVRFLNELKQHLGPGQMTFILPGGTQPSPIIIFRLDEQIKGSLLVNGFDHPLPSIARIDTEITRQLLEILNNQLGDTGLLVGDRATPDSVQVFQEIEAANVRQNYKQGNDRVPIVVPPVPIDSGNNSGDVTITAEGGNSGSVNINAGGVDISGGTDHAPGSLPGGNGGPLLIGCNGVTTPPRHFHGLIDEPMVFNRALSSNEVAAIYAAEAGSSQPVAPVLNISITSGTNTKESASGNFVLASSPVVGGQPQSVAVADVNGDGKLDLITANLGGTTLTVLTNNGAGGFGSNATLDVNSTPQCVVTADINGDGKLDLICASSAGARFLTVFTNNGAGGFVLSATPSAGNVRPYSVVAADVNGDDRLDLITANFTASTLTVFTNKSKGAFGLNSTYAVGGQPRSVAVADVNGDDKPDLICANTGDGTLTVLTNNGGGIFVSNATHAVGSQPWSVVVADVNDDNKSDLICANAGDGTLTVLTNNGSGVFGLDATYNVGSQPYSVVAADVNGDGPVDLVSANEGSGTLTVLTNMAMVATVPFKNVVLSWTTNAAGFGLQQNSILAAANWQDVTNTPAVTNGQNQVTIPVTSQNNFFRLLQQ